MRYEHIIGNDIARLQNNAWLDQSGLTSNNSSEEDILNARGKSGNNYIDFSKAPPAYATDLERTEVTKSLRYKRK